MESLFTDGIEKWRKDGTIELARGIKGKIGLGKHERKFKRCRIGMEIKKYQSHDVGICGNYTTGNLGDHAIGEALYIALTQRGYDTQRFHKYVGPTNSKVTILGGGGVIHDHIPQALEDRLSFLTGENMIIGVGYQHVGSKKGRALLRKALNEAEVVTARDQRSQQELSELCDRDIKLTACPAFTLDPPDIEPTGQTGIQFRPWLGVGAYGDKEKLVKYFEYDEDLDVEKAGQQYLNNMQTICDLVENPVYIPLDRGDEAFANECLDIPVFEYEPSVKTVLNRIASMNKMVCTRYHSNVFSILCNKPMFSITYAPKVEQLVNRVRVNSARPHAEEVNLKFSCPDRQKREEVLAAAHKNLKFIEDVIESNV